MSTWAGILLLLIVATASPAHALAAPASTSDAGTLVEESALHRHVHAIAETLRCLVCQGETVADSHASLAADMRSKIRQLLKQGRTDRQIRDYFVARYGDFVLYRPPLGPTTWALWFGPLAILVISLIMLFGYLRRRARLQAADALAPRDVERARALLHTGEESPR